MQHMAKIRLTKNELKKQKDELKRFKRYLPTLQLKKQQLQMVIRKVEQDMRKLMKEQKQLQERLEEWIAVFGENRTFPKKGKVENLIVVSNIDRERGNIAGVSIPVFSGITFKDVEYDLLEYPMWVDRALEILKQLSEYDAKISILEQQIALLQRELRTTSQRVNLFEKVKIPEAQRNIRMIQIYLGDQQTAEVVRGKIAKNKLVKVS